jgi:hypothetical protein
MPMKSIPFKNVSEIFLKRPESVSATLRMPKLVGQAEVPVPKLLPRPFIPKKVKHPMALLGNREILPIGAGGLRLHA